MGVKSLFLVCMLLSSKIFADTQVVWIGKTPVKIIRETQAPTEKTFVHLHENETTALQAARQFIQKNGGTLITLEHGGTRNIQFELQGKQYAVDPNRIFTDRGITHSLQQYSSYSLVAHQAVKKLAQAILAQIPPGKVVAVHNNSTYSLRDYLPDHPMHADAKAVHYLAQTNYRNFYFVTRQHEYERLKALDFNVALQSNHSDDDGSLSYYLGRHNYINIEAGYGELKAQLNMLYHA